MLSIISAYYKNEDLTKRFLDNLDVDAEVILVNAGSIPIEHPIITHRIDLVENVSFAHSMNTGIRASTGDYVCVIGNDVFPPKGWLGQLVKTAQETGAWITSPTNDKRGIELYQSSHIGNDVYQTNFFPAVCWLISRECINKIGLFDEQFAIGTYEDNDYARRVIDNGGTIVVDNKVVVNHLESQTMKLMGNLDDIMSKNAEIYNNKWSKL